VLARHRAITQIALAVGGPYGLALAGGYAVSEHGMGERPSGDVDLFTDWHRRGDFPAAVDAVVTALIAQGYTVTMVARAETFARLLVATTDSPDDSDKVELSADWRAHPPVVLDIGPVLHPDDAVATPASDWWSLRQTLTADSTRSCSPMPSARWHSARTPSSPTTPSPHNRSAPFVDASPNGETRSSNNTALGRTRS
jgi:hypothetical protein